MKIFVTGGSGQLGLSLKKISADYPAYDFRFADLPDADITDRDNIGRLIGDFGADVIINCAAYTSVDNAEAEPEAAYMVNCLGAANVAAIAAERNIGLVHISTDYVFDGRGNSPLKEESPTAPLGVYGSTKLAGEQAVRKSACNVVIIRTSWLYSEFGNNFLRTMLRLGSQKVVPRVVYDQTGTPTYATDLARAIMHFVGIGIKGCRTYNYSNEGVASWYDFAKEIFAISEMESKVEAVETAQYPTRAKRPAYSVLSKDRIKAEGVEVPYWRDSLRECLKNI